MASVQIHLNNTTTGASLNVEAPPEGFADVVAKLEWVQSIVTQFNAENKNAKWKKSDKISVFSPLDNTSFIVANGALAMQSSTPGQQAVVAVIPQHLLTAFFDALPNLGKAPVAPKALAAAPVLTPKAPAPKQKSATPKQPKVKKVKGDKPPKADKPPKEQRPPKDPKYPEPTFTSVDELIAWMTTNNAELLAMYPEKDAAANEAMLEVARTALAIGGYDENQLVTLIPLFTEQFKLRRQLTDLEYLPEHWTRFLKKVYRIANPVVEPIPEPVMPAPSALATVLNTLQSPTGLTPKQPLVPTAKGLNPSVATPKQSLVPAPKGLVPKMGLNPMTPLGGRQ